MTLQSSSVREMTEIERAWVGAMIEAEGCLRVNKEHPFYHLSISSNEVETIATILRLVGDGRVRIVGRAGTHTYNKDVWAWVLLKTNGLSRLLPQIIPYLTGKRNNATAVLNSIDERFA